MKKESISQWIYIIMIPFITWFYASIIGSIGGNENTGFFIVGANSVAAILVILHNKEENKKLNEKIDSLMKLLEEKKD